MVTKECFGQLANVTIRLNNSTRKHFLRYDEEKLKECDQCPLFAKCMFLKYNDVFKRMLELIDDSATNTQL